MSTGRLARASGASRFVCVQEPKGTWAVWDEEQHRIAEPLFGLAKSEALTACLILNVSKNAECSDLLAALRKRYE